MKDNFTRYNTRPSVVPVPPPRMTSDQYEAERTEILDGIPPEFASFLGYQAWEEGHSAGYEEVINVLRGSTYDFRQHLEKYRARHKITD